MDLDDFLAKIEEAKALIDSLGDKVEIDINLDGVDEALAELEELNLARDALNGRDATININLEGATIALTMLELIQAKADETSAAVTESAAASVAAAGAGSSGSAYRGWFGIPINPTTLHWIISGGSEIAAVTVPALIALGAAAMVGAEGYDWLYERAVSVYTATEATATMFGETAGSLYGLKSSLQEAQTAMDPSIFGTFGSALELISHNASNLDDIGENVTLTFQTFAAKVAAEFQPGGSLSNYINVFTANAGSDLAGLGAVFGDLGHIILVAASQMPGLAEALLRVLDMALSFATSIVDLGAKLGGFNFSIITVLMGMEEFFRWGGLLVGLLNRLGLATAVSGEKFLSWERVTSVMRGLFSILPMGIGLLGKLATALNMETVGEGLTTASEGMVGFLEKLIPATPLGFLTGAAMTAAAAGVGYLIYKMVTATTATQQFVNSLNSALDKTSTVNAPSQAFQNLAQIMDQIQQAQEAQVQLAPAIQQSYEGTSKTVQEQAAEQATLKEVTASTNETVNTLTQGIRDQAEGLNKLYTNAEWVAKTYGVTLPQALALAQAANVNLQTATFNTGKVLSSTQMKIASYMMGIQAMGASTGVVGNDMLAVAIQTGLTASKVSSLNQAWDSFMSNLTGGTSGLATFVSDMQTVGNVTTTATEQISAFSQGSTGLDLATSQIAQAMESMTTSAGSQVWTNFNSVLQQGETLMDWLRTAGASGGLGSGAQAANLFASAVLGLASQLAPMAVDSKTAQTELLGLVEQADPGITNFTQLEEAIKKSGDTLNATQSVIESATAQMGNMAYVAQQLGDVTQDAVISTMSEAKIAATGLSGAMTTYEQLLATGEGKSNAAKTAYDKVVTALEELGYTAKQAAQFIGMVSQNMNAVQSKTVTLTIKTVEEGDAAAAAKTGVMPHYTGPTAGGYASGTSGAASGWAWVGEAGPELVKFRGGETVLPNHVARGYAAGAYDSVHEVHVHLDGREISSAMQKRAVIRQRTTGTNGYTKRTR